MSVLVLWLKAIGAIVAATGFVGVAVYNVDRPATALVWLGVAFAGYLPWLLLGLWKPEPGVRLVSKPPFFARRAEPIVELPETSSVRWAILLRRVAIAAIAVSVTVYLVQELKHAI